MKILICAHDASITGGANRSLLMIVDQLLNKYHVGEIEFLLPRKEGELNDALKERGIKCHCSMYFGVTSGMRNDGKDILRFFKVYIGYALETILSIYYGFKFRNSKFDLVYTNTRGPVVGAKIAKKLRIPHVVHVREFGAEKPMFGFWEHKDIYKMSSKIILISKALYEEYAKYVPEDKLVLIHNGIDSPLNLGIKEEKCGKGLNLLLTGRLVPDKGHEDAFRALKILKDRGIDDIHLYIAGSLQKSMHIDWYQDKLNSLITELGIENMVTFCGEVKDMVALREKMDVELMCAIKETFGRVTVEGMRSCLALIGSNTGGTPEIIDDGKTGLLYEQGNPESLAEKIYIVYSDDNIRKKLAKAGYLFSQENFTPDNNVERVYQVLLEAFNVSK